jgi:hypothetical protein
MPEDEGKNGEPSNIFRSPEIIKPAIVPILQEVAEDGNS